MACENKPGFYTPDQVVKFLFSKRMMLSEALVNNILKFEIAFEKEKDGSFTPVLFLAPASTVEPLPGYFFDNNDRNPCIHFKDGKCLIHYSGFKPYECIKFHHSIGEGLAHLAPGMNLWRRFWEMDQVTSLSLKDLRFDYIPNLADKKYWPMIELKLSHAAHEKKMNKETTKLRLEKVRELQEKGEL
jgi:hypothetical protein